MIDHNGHAYTSFLNFIDCNQELLIVQYAFDGVEHSVGQVEVEETESWNGKRKWKSLNLEMVIRMVPESVSHCTGNEVN